jgi:hypothetical protein
VNPYEIFNIFKLKCLDIDRILSFKKANLILTVGPQEAEGGKKLPLAGTT